ncbi:MAG TPA: hypothetical protein VL346_08805 [Acidobacteriaceae bacterium]|nr:hypothetical protein [Acidobacteriaceae bacterium]
MRPEEIGRRFGIGVRVAGRIAKDRIESSSPGAPNTQNGPSAPTAARVAQSARAAGQKGRAAGRATRAVGRGVGGFLRPFSRVGGILWLEVTGFFFGLFAVFFAVTLWRSRADYIQGPHHQQFLIAAVLTVVFVYLSVSSFLRANRR